MDNPTPNYRGAFFSSPHHAVLGLLTLGGGFLSAEMLPLIAGLTIYALGWIYLPDLGFFRHWVDGRNASGKQAEELLKVTEFARKRENLLASLTPERRERYRRLAAVCTDIETASSDNPLAPSGVSTDPRLRKLDELMWTFLRLLTMEESLDRFLETERGENVPTLLQDAEAEVTRLKADQAKAGASPAAIETRQRYLASREERLDVLRKRQERTVQAEANLQLAVSEQERLDQQIKLIRADAVASKNAETLTARIDATVEHLDQTNKWLSELDEFKDLVGDLPDTDLRLGYQAPSAAATRTAVAPPVIAGVKTQSRRGQQTN